MSAIAIRTKDNKGPQLGSPLLRALTVEAPHSIALAAAAVRADGEEHYLDEEEVRAIVLAEQVVTGATPLTFLQDIVRLLNLIGSALVMYVVMAGQWVVRMVTLGISQLRLLVSMITVRMMPRPVAKLCLWSMTPLCAGRFKGVLYMRTFDSLAGKLGFRQNYYGSTPLPSLILRGLLGTTLWVAFVPALLVLDLAGFVVETSVELVAAGWSSWIRLSAPAYMREQICWMRQPPLFEVYAHWNDDHTRAVRDGIANA